MNAFFRFLLVVAKKNMLIQLATYIIYKKYAVDVQIVNFE